MTRAEQRRGGEVPPERRRRWLVWTVLSVLVAVAVVVGGPWLYARIVHGEETEPLALSTASPTVGATDGPVAEIEVDGAWQVGAGSRAGYRLGEVLSGQQVTVVGRTEEVSGTVTIADGMLTAAQVVVDPATISTDESARDAYFRRALDTTEFPEATFVLDEPVDVSAVGSADDAVEVAATGTLTFHGVSRPAVAALQVQRTDTGIEVVGTIPVLLEDFGLGAPDLGFVTVDPSGEVELLLMLTR